MYRAVNKCKEYNELPWPSDRKPVSELYAYIAFIVISIMCMPFFVLTAVCKVGNYAGDGVRLGRDDVVRSRGSVGSTPSGSTLDVGATGASVGDSSNPGAPDSLVRKTHRSDSEVMSYWRHCGPLSNSFHVLAAFSLLLPNILLDARKIEHGFLDPGEFKDKFRNFLHFTKQKKCLHWERTSGCSGVAAFKLPDTQTKCLVIDLSCLPVVNKINHTFGCNLSCV